jgi:hypothetical protein
MNTDVFAGSAGEHLKVPDDDDYGSDAPPPPPQPYSEPEEYVSGFTRGEIANVFSQVVALLFALNSFGMFGVECCEGRYTGGPGHDGVCCSTLYWSIMS